MDLALLFNSDDPKFDGYYGDPIRDIVFSTAVIQASNRHMKLSVGDVLIFSKAKTEKEYAELTAMTYYTEAWTKYVGTRLQESFWTSTVYALVFENITEEITKSLHDKLVEESSYLGFTQVDYTYPPHLALFKNCMVPLYRLRGNSCRIFYNMGDEDSQRNWDVEALRILGYDDIEHEDLGAHGTIFDDYDSLKHYRRRALFRRGVAPYLHGGEDAAYELVMVLQDLNPKLFNVLSAAVAAIERAEDEEDVAHASISGRRYMEKLADVLFAPQTEKRGNRNLGREQFKNRLWAYVEDNTLDDATQFQIIGKEIDRLLELFNKGLHSDLDIKSIKAAFADLSNMTVVLLSLDPESVRKPYYAHRGNLNAFYEEVIGISDVF